MHIAASNGHVECCRLLLNRGADRNITNYAGQTPLQIASNDEIRQLLSTWSPVQAVSSSPVPVPTSSSPASCVVWTSLDSMMIQQQLQQGTATSSAQQFSQTLGLTARSGVWRAVTEIAISERDNKQAMITQLQQRITTLQRDCDGANQEKQEASERIVVLKRELAQAEETVERATQAEKRAKEEMKSVSAETNQTQTALEHIKTEQKISEEELMKSLQAVADLETAVQSGNIGKLEGPQMKELMKEAGLGEFIGVMEKQQVMNGESLADLNDHDLTEYLGMSKMKDRKRLKSTLDMVKHCKAIRLANKQTAEATTTNNGKEEKEKGKRKREVKTAMWWDEQQVFEWLIENNIPIEVCETLRAQGVSGEILMYLSKDELLKMATGKITLGMAGTLNRLATQLNEQFFASNQSSHPIPAAAAASSSSTVSSSASVVVSEPPHEFICPITQEVMSKPVVLSGDGFVYEMSAIEKWLDGGHNTSPMTGGVLSSVNLIPCHTLHSAIMSFLEIHPEHHPSTAH